MTARQAKPHGISEIKLAVLLDIHGELYEFKNVARKGWKTHHMEGNHMFKSWDPTEINESVDGRETGRKE